MISSEIYIYIGEDIVHQDVAEESDICEDHKSAKILYRRKVAVIVTIILMRKHVVPHVIPSLNPLVIQL